VNLYLDLFQNAGEEEEELADILTNMLACASNQDSSEARAPVEKLVEKTSGQVERTYEFFFNLCQV
jgi:ferritin-like metal-binding protein YciE